MGDTESGLDPLLGGQLDARCIGLADEQDGVVCRRQLLALGMSPKAVDVRVARGWLVVRHRGVYAVGRRRLTDRGEAMAAHLAAGERSTVSHQSAALLLDYPLPHPPTVHVTSPTAAPRAELHVHRGDPARHWLGNLPVTTPAQTVADLAPHLRPAALESVLDAAVRLHDVDAEAIRAFARGRPGARRLGRVLPHAAPSRSVLETAFKRLCRRHGLPELPVINAEWLHTGGRTLEVDALFPRHGIAVELDSEAHHKTARDRRADRRKDTLYRTAGLIPRRYDHDDVTRRAAETAHDLRLLMAAVARGAA